MKRKKRIIFLLVTMTCFVLTGCWGERAYDKRLLLADSLLSVNADSALWRLQHIKNYELGSERDRAYHALLLTQARYKCYIVATSDSDINIALDYYEKHDNEREKLTRAYIFKGAVMEELEQYQPAMEHYKKALEVAAPDDYYNQGYVRYRLGCIYREHLVSDSADITYFKDALRYFQQVPDSQFVVTCLNDIGLSYYKNNRDSVQPYLDRALAIAQHIGNVVKERQVSISIAKTSMFSSQPQDVEKAKRIVLSLLADRTGIPPDELADLLMTATYTLARQNKADSAQIFLHQLPKVLPNSSHESFRLLCQAEVARAQRDINRYAQYSNAYRQLSESIIKDDLQYHLRDVESMYDNETLKLKNERYKWLLKSWLLFALLALSVLALLLLQLMHRASQRKRQLADHEATIERLKDDTLRLSTLLEDNKAMNENLKNTLKNQILTFSQVMEVYMKDYSKDPKKFDTAFKKAYSVNQPDASFWQGIKTCADLTHNGIITHVIENYPTLKEIEIRLLSLYCCDLPTTVIMACMGYNEVHAFYNRRRRLAQAMNLPNRLEDYVKEYDKAIGNRRR